MVFSMIKITIVIIIMILAILRTTAEPGILSR